MKKILFLICLIAICYNMRGQALKDIAMTEDKVSVFIFSSPIVSFKGGFIPSDFAVSTEANVLYMQPLGGFVETNMHIITADKCYYMFNIKYNKQTTTFTHIFTPEDAIYRENANVAGSSGTPTNTTPGIAAAGSKEALTSNCERILSRSGYLVSGNTAKVRNMAMTLKGVYSDDKFMYLRIVLDNESNIGYEIEHLLFASRSIAQRRRSTQENIQLVPTFIYNLPEEISAKQTKEIIACFDRFTINNDKELQISCIEKNGERSLNLDVENKIILDARKY